MTKQRKNRQKLTHRRLKLAEAQAFTAAHHRHAAPLKRHIFSTGALAWLPIDDMSNGGGYRCETLVGLATIDHCSSHEWSKRPDHVELRRLCLSPQAPVNTASFLIGKACQAVFGIGYRCLITYTRPWETGASLKAAGFWIQKRSRMRCIDGVLSGGLVQWIRVAGIMPDASERAFTNRILNETHAVLDQWEPTSIDLTSANPRPGPGTRRARRRASGLKEQA